jgi:hypothetical protein
MFTGTIRTSMDPAHDQWSHIRNCFVLSGRLQYYLALRFNITTGSNSIQDTALRPWGPGVVSCTQERVVPIATAVQLAMRLTF